MQQITAEKLKAQIDNGQQPVILDVREDWEYEICHLDNSMHIAMSSVPEKLDELEKDEPIVVLCHHGARSMQVAGFLESQGFRHISNLEGGIHEWSIRVDPDVAQY